MTVSSTEWNRIIKEKYERERRLGFWRTADQAIKAWQTELRGYWEYYDTKKPRPEIPTLLYSPDYGWMILDGNVGISKKEKNWISLSLLPGDNWIIYERAVFDKRDPDFNETVW